MNWRAILLFNLFILINRLSYSQDWLWAKNIGGLTNDQATKIISHDDFYISGLFESDPCYYDTNTMYPMGIEDMFIAKYSNSGFLKWVINFGGDEMISNAERISRMACDLTGQNIYITGQYQNSLFHDSLLLAGSQNNTDLFFAKLDSSGTFQWIIGAGGTATDVGVSLIVDSSGFIYLGAVFNSSGTINNIPVSKGMNLFKFDSNGNILWTKKLGENVSFDMKLKNGNLFFSGASIYTYDTFYVDTIQFISRGLVDMIFGKFDTLGNLIWVNREGWNGYDVISGYDVDDSTNIYISGVIRDSTIIENDTLRNYRLFLAKFDDGGGFQWSKSFGSKNNSSFSTSLAIDHQFNLYICGGFSDTMYFINSQLIPTGLNDAFLIKYSNSGNFIGSDQISNSSSYSISIDNSGRPVVAGSFGYQITTSAGTILSHGQDDAFIAMHDEITGTGELERRKNELLIYANPTTGKCTISVPDELLHGNNKLTLNVYDNTGKVIQSIPFHTDMESLKVNLENEAKGIYLVTLSDGTKIYKGRIVFQ